MTWWWIFSENLWPQGSLVESRLKAVSLGSDTTCLEISLKTSEMSKQRRPGNKLGRLTLLGLHKCKYESTQAWKSFFFIIVIIEEKKYLYSFLPHSIFILMGSHVRSSGNTTQLWHTAIWLFATVWFWGMIMESGEGKEWLMHWSQQGVKESINQKGNILLFNILLIPLSRYNVRYIFKTKI